MECNEPSPVSPLSRPSSSDNAEAREWLLRVVGGLATVGLVWLSVSIRSTLPVLLLLLLPLIAGTLVNTIRVSRLTEGITLVEKRVASGSEDLASQHGNVARFVRRPIYSAMLGVFRLTASVADIHFRAGIRLSAVLFIWAVAVALLATIAYIALAVILTVVVLAVIARVLGAIFPNSTIVRFSRLTTDWMGRPKEEHFDASGNKLGESRPDTDWLGRPITVHTDARGKEVGESRTETDVLGGPIVVHSDAQGNKTGESRPEFDLLGRPTAVHTDVLGNIASESREEVDALGRPRSVHRIDVDQN